MGAGLPHTGWCNAMGKAHGMRKGVKMEYVNDERLNQREENLLEAAKAAPAPSLGDMMAALMEKYKRGEWGKIYYVNITVQVDDDTEEHFVFLFRKPKPASYDRYIKTMSNSVTKASNSFVFDNIIEEQKELLRETVEEYPAMTISLAEKLLRLLGLADSTSVKKL